MRNIQGKRENKQCMHEVLSIECNALWFMCVDIRTRECMA